MIPSVPHCPRTARQIVAGGRFPGAARRADNTSISEHDVSASTFRASSRNARRWCPRRGSGHPAQDASAPGSIGKNSPVADVVVQCLRVTGLTVTSRSSL